MRIAHVGTSISLNQVVLNQMAYQSEKGHDIIALCPEDEWAEAIKARGIRVIPTPFARHSLLATLAAAVGDIRVLTSQFEGVPHALMGSMALGLPVVAEDVPGTRMLVGSVEMD